jgi:hypothetical protein
VELAYLYLDGSHFRMPPGARAEPMRLGTTTCGSPVLVGLAPGASEGPHPWAGFLDELVHRGPRAPLLVSIDGAAGLIGAGRGGSSLLACGNGVRCTEFATWSRVTTHAQAEVNAAYWQGCTTSPPNPATEQWPSLPAGARLRRPLRQARPAAVQCLTDTCRADHIPVD